MWYVPFLSASNIQSDPSRQSVRVGVGPSVDIVQK